MNLHDDDGFGFYGFGAVFTLVYPRSISVALLETIWNARAIAIFAWFLQAGWRLSPKRSWPPVWRSKISMFGFILCDAVSSHRLAMTGAWMNLDTMRGTSPWTNHLYESFYAGCIPVILSDEYEVAFAADLPWQKFSIKWPETGLLRQARQIFARQMIAPISGRSLLCDFCFVFYHYMCHVMWC